VTPVLTDYLGPTEAARRLGVSADRVRQLCADGRLTFTWSPLGRLIDRDAVERLARERAEAGGA
jgi:excisionase family DNA binding protein